MSAFEKFLDAAIKIAKDEHMFIDDFVGKLLNLSCTYGKKKLGTKAMLAELCIQMIIVADGDEDALDKAVCDMKTKAALMALNRDGAALNGVLSTIAKA